MNDRTDLMSSRQADIRSLRDRYPHGAALRSSVSMHWSAPGQVDFHHELESSGPSLRLAKIPEAIAADISRLRDGIGWALANDDTNHLLLLLDQRNMIRSVVKSGGKDASLENQLLYLADLFVDAVTAQAGISAASVAIVGCGGTGGVVVQHLVAAGVRAFVCIDADVVEYSNLLIRP